MLEGEIMAIGDGWHKLVQELIKDLEKLELSEVSCIKEKFGHLRVYASCGSKYPEVQEKFIQRIVATEEESSKVCEKCGSRDEVATDSWNGYWLKTLCQKCGQESSSKPIYE